MTGTAVIETDGSGTYFNAVPFRGYPTNHPQTEIILPPQFDMTPTAGEIIVPNGQIYISNTATTCTTYYRQITGMATITSTSNTWTNVVTTGTGNMVTYCTSGTSNWIVYGSEFRGFSPEEAARQKRQYERSQRGRITKARSAIKKALKLIDNIGFGDEIRIFIGGDEIVIDNPDSIFKFVLKRGTHRIVEKTISPGFSTPYSLELLTKDDVHVANLCVYIKDTPVLDQVLAIAMYIKSGEEEDVLTKANWFNRTDDDGVRRLVHEYNPKFGRKLGFKVPGEEPRGHFVDNIQGIIIANNTLPQLEHAT